MRYQKRKVACVELEFHLHRSGRHASSSLLLLLLFISCPSARPCVLSPHSHSHFTTVSLPDSLPPAFSVTWMITRISLVLSVCSLPGFYLCTYAHSVNDVSIWWMLVHSLSVCVLQVLHRWGKEREEKEKRGDRRSESTRMLQQVQHLSFQLILELLLVDYYRMRVCWVYKAGRNFCLVSPAATTATNGAWAPGSKTEWERSTVVCFLERSKTLRHKASSAFASCHSLAFSQIHSRHKA